MESKNQDTLVSIIVTFYNQQKYIPICLESLINQSYKNIEIICVNDASTDSSSKFLNYYQKLDPRVKVINNPQNLNLVKSRKIGFENSKGELITFVDGDDYLYPATINQMVIAYNKYQTPDLPIGAVSCEIRIVADNSINAKRYSNIYHSMNPLSSKCESEKVILSNQIIDNYNSRDIWTSVVAKLIQRELVAKIYDLVDDTVFFGEDLEFNFFLAKIMTEEKMNFLKIPTQLYYYLLGSSDSFNYVKRFQKNTQDFVNLSLNILKHSKTESEISMARYLINRINSHLIYMINSTQAPQKYQMKEIYLDNVSEFVLNSKVHFSKDSINKIKDTFS